MEEEQEPSAAYIKAFNMGYQLQKNDPEMLKQILATDDKKSENFKALVAGRKQWEVERLKAQTKQISEKEKDRER